MYVCVRCKHVSTVAEYNQTQLCGALLGSSSFCTSAQSKPTVWTHTAEIRQKSDILLGAVVKCTQCELLTGLLVH